MSGYTPATADCATLSVTFVVEVEPLVETLPTVAVTPAGRPVTATSGVPLNRPRPSTVTGIETVPPAAALPLAGSNEIASVPGMSGSSPSQAWREAAARSNDARALVLVRERFIGPS